MESIQKRFGSMAGMFLSLYTVRCRSGSLDKYYNQCHIFALPMGSSQNCHTNQRGKKIKKINMNFSNLCFYVSNSSWMACNICVSLPAMAYISQP